MFTLPARIIPVLFCFVFNLLCISCIHILGGGHMDALVLWHTYEGQRTKFSGCCFFFLSTSVSTEIIDVGYCVHLIVGF